LLGIYIFTLLTSSAFDYTLRYIDDVVLLNNLQQLCLHLIYPAKLKVKDTSNLDLYLEHNINGTLTTKLYDKRDDFNILIVSYPFLDSTIPSSHA